MQLKKFSRGDARGSISVRTHMMPDATLAAPIRIIRAVKSIDERRQLATGTEDTSRSPYYRSRHIFLDAISFIMIYPRGELVPEGHGQSGHSSPQIPTMGKHSSTVSSSISATSR